MGDHQEEEYDPTVENMVVASSSADEAEGKKTTTEAAAGGGKSTEEAQVQVGCRGPRMNHEEFFDRYPCIDTNVTRYRHATRSLKDVIVDCLVFVSRRKLDELEEEWMNYYREKWELSAQRMVLVAKEWALLKEAQQAYNNKNKNKKKKNKKRKSRDDQEEEEKKMRMSEFVSRYPCLSEGLLDDMDQLSGSEAKVTRTDYLMMSAEDRLQGFERELESYYQALLRHANKLWPLLEKQTTLLHMATKAYRRYRGLPTDP